MQAHSHDFAEVESDDVPPIWVAFGDLMACLFGLFVLFFVGLVTMQVALTEDLEQEHAELLAAEAKLDAFERALSGPLQAGLITLVNGRIGIRGSVLFNRGKADLRPEGRVLLRELVPPLKEFLDAQRQAVMVSGFTDDLRVRPMSPFKDNWELSAERALTVTRTLIDAGMPPGWIIAAGFGEHHPLEPNSTEPNRAKNRRVEISPVPRPEPEQWGALVP